MKVELFAMCDAANDSGGKLNMLGVYDTINAPATPVVQPRCSLAIKVRFDRIERGDHRLKLGIVDPDGKPVVPPLEAPLKMAFPDTIPSAAAQLILDLQNVRFERFGEFAIDLAIDGRHEASIPLFVRQVQRPPAHAPQAQSPG